MTAELRVYSAELTELASAKFAKFALAIWGADVALRRPGSSALRGWAYWTELPALFKFKGACGATRPKASFADPRV